MSCILRARSWGVVFAVLLLSSPVGMADDTALSSKAVKIEAKYTLQPMAVAEFCASPLPKFLEGATIYTYLPKKENKDASFGVLKVAFEQDTAVYMAGHWNANDKETGDWTAEVMQEYQIAGDGWVLVGELDFLNRAFETHRLYWRQFRRGETVTLRTEKARPPLLIVPAVPDSNPLALVPSDSMSAKLSDDIFSSKLERLLRTEQFAELEATVANIRREKSRNRNGRSMLSAFYEGTKPKATTEEAWVRDRKIFEAWAEKYPQSAAAQISLSHFWIFYAFQGRRLGGQRYPTQEGMSLFMDRMATARKIIEKSYELEEQDPYACRVEMWLAADLKYTKEQVEKIFEHAMKIDPDYTATLLDGVRFYMPRIRGEPGDMEKFAERAVEMTRERWGDCLYAHIVMEVAEYRAGDTFKEYKFDWKRVKSSAAEYRKRFPELVTADEMLVRLAAYQDDRAEAHAAFERLDKRNVKLNYFTERQRNWSRLDLLDGEQTQITDAIHFEILRLDWTVDGTRWITLDNNLGLSVFDADEAKLRSRVYVESDVPKFAAAIPFGKSMVAAGWGEQVLLYTIASGKVQELGKHPIGVSSAAISSDGSEWATASFAGKVMFWSLDGTSEFPDEWNLAPVVTTSLAYVPSSRLIAIGGGDRHIGFWNRDTKQKEFELPKFESSIRQIRASADGTKLAVYDHTYISLFELEGRKLLAKIPLPKPYINDIALSRDGRFLAAGTGSRDSKTDCHVLVWNTADGSLRNTFLGHKQRVNTVCFSPDGSKLASGSADMTIRVWKIE